ncbi:hypothetical protein GGI12_005503 [Dipsacomyces acuminosporus]|nr:hypothetical protein GGI12_005503 [Dipsacomyces acuminosporus]
MRRRLLNLADNHSQSNQNAQQLREMTDEEIREIVQQEWTRFRREMEQQSMEYGFLDEDIIADIENDMRLSSGRGGDVYYQESYEDYGMDEHDYNSFMEMEQVEDPEWEEFAGWEQYQDALMMADMEQPQAMDSTGNHRHM